MNLKVIKYFYFYEVLNNWNVVLCPRYMTYEIIGNTFNEEIHLLILQFVFIKGEIVVLACGAKFVESVLDVRTFFHSI